MRDEPGNSLTEGENYYAFLNIPKNATEEDISNAYRRLSRVYHPDKHADPERKKEAELLFSKTKKAYEALIDPHLRAIYDNLGTAGLETQGWEIVQRTKTPQEIRAEYEQLAREQEERRLQVRTNPKSSINVSINATELFAPSDDIGRTFDLRDFFGIPHIEVSGLSLTQAIEAPLTSRDTALMSGSLTTHNGRGSGTMNCSIRRVMSSKAWGELEVGAGNGLGINLKGFTNFSQGFFGNGNVMTQFSPHGIRVGSVATIGHQLDKETLGYLTWKTGMPSGMTTMIIRDTEKWHMIASIYFGVPHSFCSLSLTHKMPSIDTKLRVTGKVGTFGLVFEYGAEKQISQHSSLAAKVSIGVLEGIHLRLKLHRASQTYATSILLSDDVLPAPIIYGTIIPLVGWFALQKLVIQPYLKQKKLEDLQRQREANKVRLAEKKQEAAASIQLMKETVKRNVDQEEAKKGLVILQALFGLLVIDNTDNIDEPETENNNIIDVTIPLQCLVKDSKLLLQDSSKSQLPGFYDPCPGEDKFLRLRYLFHAVIHQVTIKDEESLRIPKQSHRIDP